MRAAALFLLSALFAIRARAEQRHGHGNDPPLLPFGPEQPKGQAKEATIANHLETYAPAGREVEASVPRGASSRKLFDPNPVNWFNIKKKKPPSKFCSFKPEKLRKGMCKVRVTKTCGCKGKNRRYKPAICEFCKRVRQYSYAVPELPGKCFAQTCFPGVQEACCVEGDPMKPALCNMCGPDDKIIEDELLSNEQLRELAQGKAVDEEASLSRSQAYFKRLAQPSPSPKAANKPPESTVALTVLIIGSILILGGVCLILRKNKNPPPLRPQPLPGQHSDVNVENPAFAPYPTASSPNLPLPVPTTTSLGRSRESQPVRSCLHRDKNRSSGSPSVPTYTQSRSTNQRIEEWRLRRELVTQQPPEQKVRQLRQEEQVHAEQVHKAQACQTERVQGTIKDQVQRWATKKSLIRMLCTLEKIMPRDRVPLPKLDLRPNSTAADVKKAYKHALRAVHPDKLATASVDDRVRAGFVFSALRESYERFSLTVDD